MRLTRPGEAFVEQLTGFSCATAGDYDSPKVTKLDERHPLAGHDEGVLRLQISVHDALSVTVL